MQAGVAKYRRGEGVVNGEGRMVDVVHQYDRDGELQDHLFREFVEWDMAVEGVGEGGCEGYIIKEVRNEWGKRSGAGRSRARVPFLRPHPKSPNAKEEKHPMKLTLCFSDPRKPAQNTEAYKGICDLSHDPGSDYLECCKVCNGKPNCRGFTHIRKGCWLKTCGNNGNKELKVVGATGAWKV
jgi:hypothetical protein